MAPKDHCHYGSTWTNQFAIRATIYIRQSYCLEKDHKQGQMQCMRSGKSQPVGGSVRMKAVQKRTPNILWQLNLRRHIGFQRTARVLHSLHHLNADYLNSGKHQDGIIGMFLNAPEVLDAETCSPQAHLVRCKSVDLTSAGQDLR
ncbi:hypothetical protein AX15_005818 [Amanita polypyramis BW_CC]|nr:hypothetical protein AX15_005818 [Amanita polypyramis BW_CC]